MDGKDLIRRSKELLHIKSTDTDFNERGMYDYLYAAARQWVIQTECLTTTQSITTVASQAGYTLDGDYLSMFLKHNDRYYLKYNDGTTDYFLYFKPYQEVIFDNNTTAITIPANFTILDDPTLDDLISGSASAIGTHVGGKSTLAVASATFADVTPGDIVHNTKTGNVSDGVVVGYTSTTSIDTCMFLATTGAAASWASADTFFIQPRKRFKLQFDPPPSTADHTATFYYLQKPNPVYSDYDVYTIAYDYGDVLCKYAAWLYKYRDQEPQFGDAFYKYWDMQIKDYRRLTRKGLATRSRIIPHWSR